MSEVDTGRVFKIVFHDLAEAEAEAEVKAKVSVETLKAGPRATRAPSGALEKPWTATMVGMMAERA